MKLNDIKHNHSLTDLLKILIFSLLMLAPLLASVSQMLYTTFNKNAYQSYYGETINKEIYNEVSFEDLEVNKTYNFIGMTLEGSYTLVENQNKFYCSKIVLNDTTYTNSYFGIYNNGTTTYVFFRDSDNNILTSHNINATQFEFVYLSTTTSETYFNIYKNAIREIEYNNYSYLDNAFYYGVDQMTKSDLFNWTQNTAIYNGLNTMTSQLGIQTNAIPILLTYWFILTIIYVIIDIILKAYTTITHMLQKK